MENTPFIPAPSKRHVIGLRCAPIPKVRIGLVGLGQRGMRTLSEKQQEVIDRVLKMDLKSVSDQLMAQAMAQAQEEFQEAERKGKALEAARRG